jgi:hypothetical protein
MPADYDCDLVLAVYLTGSTLFLSLLLARVFHIVLDLITIQEDLNALKTKVSMFCVNYQAEDTDAPMTAKSRPPRDLFPPSRQPTSRRE